MLQFKFDSHESGVVSLNSVLDDLYLKSGFSQAVVLLASHLGLQVNDLVSGTSYYSASFPMIRTLQPDGKTALFPAWACGQKREGRGFSLGKNLTPELARIVDFHSMIRRFVYRADGKIALDTTVPVPPDLRENAADNDDEGIKI